MRLLEGAGAARATATGMAAVTSSLLCFLKAGDHVVAARALFGSCRYVVEDLCPRFGIASTLVDGRDIEAWERAMRPNTKAVFFETPANPTLDLVDIAAVAEIAHGAGALVVVDNVFATPGAAEAPDSSAPTSSSIPPPSTSTARAAASAASCWARKPTSRITCTTSSSTPGPRSAPSTPG